MPKADENDGGWRRKSAGFMSGSQLGALTPIDKDEKDEKGVLKKKLRPKSFFSSSSSATVDREKQAKDKEENQGSPKARPRNTNRSRPSSIFATFRSSRLGNDEEQVASPVSRASSVEEGAAEKGAAGAAPVSPVSVILRHGEVHSTSGLFKKRKEYLVLTDLHLMRFKSQAKAAEAFPSLTLILGRGESTRHASMASTGSASDFHAALAQSSDSQARVRLRQVVAVFRLDDGRPYFAIEVAHLDEESGHATTMNLHFGDPVEANQWTNAIRAAASKARTQNPTPFPQRSIEHVAWILEQERDYDPAHFRIFKVVQRSSKSSRASTDDLAKLTSTICYLVIGVHKIHLVPLHRPLNRTSSTSLSDMDSRNSHGILSLVSAAARTVDDLLELGFRLPLCQQQVVQLASAASVDIVIAVRAAAEYLRPQWLEQPILFKVPSGLEDAVPLVDAFAEDHGCFDRTLTAYCAAYDIDTSNIRYTIDYDVEDAPQFALLTSATPGRPNYSAPELLAVLRALRFNETFCSISFRGISLDPLHQLRDEHGIDHIAFTTRSGGSLNLVGLGQKSLLVQEIQAISIKSKKLRRMDFSYTISRKSCNYSEGDPDPGCEIVEALFPLCRRQLTNVDWIILNGIELDETDLDYLVDAAVQRACHFRALEVSRCGLTDRSLTLILNAMRSQESTLESIDISANLARLSPSSFQGQIGHFGFIRKLNLSRVHRTSGPEPLVAPETILAWRLEELQLSETAINEQTVDSISAYLTSPMSNTLRDVRLNQCGLTGEDVAVFLHAMSRGAGKERNLHLHVSENRLERGHDKLVAAIAKSYSPSHLTMRMVEYTKEDHFRELVLAVKSNRTLKYLDISKASLPYDAGPETCQALKEMFIDNDTLEELDISGEYAHLEVAKFGIGLNHALTGLKSNRALKVLRIEYQKLGLQGASTLSEVLDENRVLREIYCDHNDINLQAMTALVDGLIRNTTLLYLPAMDHDRMASLQRLEKEIRADSHEPFSPIAGGKLSSARRRTLVSAVRGSSSSSTGRSTPAPAAGAPGHSRHQAASSPASAFTDQDVRAALEVVHEKWDRQAARLRLFLERNAHLVNAATDATAFATAAVDQEETPLAVVHHHDDDDGEPQSSPSGGSDVPRSATYSFSSMLRTAAPTLERDDSGHLAAVAAARDDDNNNNNDDDDDNAEPYLPALLSPSTSAFMSPFSSPSRIPGGSRSTGGGNVARNGIDMAVYDKETQV